MSERRPQYMQLITSKTRWDWRKENPVELVLLVFIVALFFSFPRQGCGVTSKTRLLTPQQQAASQQNKASQKTKPKATPKKTQPKTAKPRPTGRN